MVPTQTVLPAPDLFGHPRGLFVLFFAEMWERFSFYGMRALLIFYLTQHFLFGDAEAAGIYAAYGSLVYLTPVIGGLVADRYLGFRRAVTLGAVLLTCGHFGMAFEGEPALRDGAGEPADGAGVVRDAVSLQVFYFSLALIIVGVGFLKPSISSMVGHLYGERDARRDGGFTIFYMGINLGAFTAALICGWLGQNWGWAYGFGLAGIGMLAGLLTFLRGQSLLGTAGAAPTSTWQPRHVAWPLTQRQVLLAGTCTAVLLAWQLVQLEVAVGGLLLTIGAAAVGLVVWHALTQCTPIERDRLVVVLTLTAASVVFWSLFEQAGSSLNLFTERNVVRTLGSTTFEASQFQSLNPGFIILLAPLFSWLWPLLAARGIEPSTPAKFALGIVQVGLGFLMLVIGATNADGDGLVAVGYLVAAYFLHTTGELCLSPVGLSMVTRLSTPRILGLVMGVWFLSSACSHYVAGFIARLAAVPATSDGVADRAASLAIYAQTFELVTWCGLAAGAMLLAAAPWLHRRMHSSEVGNAAARPGGQQI